MLWTLALILTLSGLALFAYLLWQRTSIDTGSFSLSDLTNIATLVIAIFSLYVAVAAYQQSVKDGKEQQENIDASRRQLQAVVDAATKQQELLKQNLETSKSQQQILTTNLETSKAQLGLLQEQWRREQEHLARKPIAEVTMWVGGKETSIEEIRKLTEVEFRLEKGKEWGRWEFNLRNRGNTEIIKPFVKVSVSPTTISVFNKDYRINDGLDHHSLQFDNLRDIEPIEVTKIPYRFTVDIMVPQTEEQFDLFFSVHGSNLPRQQWKIHAKVIREAPE